MSALRLETFMCWVPLVGSALGSVLGGFLSDLLVRRRRGGAGAGLLKSEERLRSESQEAADRDATDGSEMRMLVAGAGTLLSLPLVMLALSLGFPYCFLVMVASGLVGEVYLSQALAIVTESRTVPAALVTQSVAVFMLVVTVVGGNAPLLVPWLVTAVGYRSDVTVEFQAAPEPAALGGTVQYSVLNTDVRQLQCSMMWILGGSYGLSGLLYLVCYYLMSRRKFSLDDI